MHVKRSGAGGEWTLRRARSGGFTGAAGLAGIRAEFIHRSCTKLQEMLRNDQELGHWLACETIKASSLAAHRRDASCLDLQYLLVP